MFLSSSRVMETVVVQFTSPVAGPKDAPASLFLILWPGRANSDSTSELFLRLALLLLLLSSDIMACLREPCPFARL